MDDYESFSPAIQPFIAFKPGEEVICIDDYATYIEGKDHCLKAQQTYTVVKQSYAGYVWVKDINSPYIPSRFKHL